jgi:hypothetical protein
MSQGIQAKTSRLVHVVQCGACIARASLRAGNIAALTALIQPPRPENMLCVALPPRFIQSFLHFSQLCCQRPHGRLGRLQRLQAPAQPQTQSSQLALIHSSPTAMGRRSPGTHARPTPASEVFRRQSRIAAVLTAAAHPRHLAAANTARGTQGSDSLHPHLRPRSSRSWHSSSAATAPDPVANRGPGRAAGRSKPTSGDGHAPVDRGHAGFPAVRRLCQLHLQVLGLLQQRRVSLRQLGHLRAQPLVLLLQLPDCCLQLPARRLHSCLQQSCAKAA